MPPANPSAIADEIAAFRGTTEEVIEALAGTFRPSRIAVATLGLAATFVAALGFGAYAGVLVLRNSMEAAAFAGILAGVVLYAGKLLTYGALCRMAAVERQGETLAPGAAFSFAFSRAHTLLGLPLFALLVALGLGLLGVKIGFEAGDSQTLGSGLGAVVVILVFVLNFFLLCAVLVSHILTAPCVACTDRPFSAVGERLIQLFHEQLHQFLACQVPVLLAGLPVLLLSAGLLFGAFQPAFYSVASGRARAEARQPLTPSSREAAPAGTESAETARPAPATPGGLRRWVGRMVAAGGPSLAGVAALALLLMMVAPLNYWAAAETAVYLGLTGDAVRVAAAEPRPERERERERAPVLAAEPVGEKKHPPIVHCWRCDAINRYDGDYCVKCGAEYVVCPHCFATNEVARKHCSTCNGPLTPEPAKVAQPIAGGK